MIGTKVLYAKAVTVCVLLVVDPTNANSQQGEYGCGQNGLNSYF